METLGRRRGVADQAFVNQSAALLQRTVGKLCAEAPDGEVIVVGA